MSAPALRRRPPAAGTQALTDVRNLRRMRTALRQGLRGITAAPLVFALSVATMGAGLLMLSAYLLVLSNVRSVVASYGADLSLVAFLPAGAAPGEAGASSLREKLVALPGVARVEFVSIDDALERLRAELGADASVLEGLSENPLPASYEITLEPQARTPERLRALAQQVSALGGVDDVRWGEAWIESYASILRALQWLGLGLGACMLLVLGVIVSGTIRLAVHARADEIQIQRLVGAGAFFVRLPFYVEAALQGALGAGLALALLYLLFEAGAHLLGETFPVLLGGRPAFFGPFEITGLVLLAVTLGVGAAVLSLTRIEEQQ